MAIRDLFSLFDLRAAEARVFEVLYQNPPLRASQLARLAHFSRTAVYDLLENLIKKGLVYESLKDEVKVFTAHPPEKIALLMTEKENELASAKQALQALKHSYQKISRSFKPRLELYEGRSALQQMMKDLLLYPNITVRAFWPIKNILQLLTPEFFQEFQAKRLKENIELKVIWPAKQIPSFQQFPFLKPARELKREVRIAPKEVDFSLGYTIYGNTVRFISSSKENFGFLIESYELSEMMKTQFDQLWALSKPLK